MKYLKFSGFRILTPLKIAYLLIFRIQDPESSGSDDLDGKSHEGPWLNINVDVPLPVNTYRVCMYCTQSHRVFGLGIPISTLLGPPTLILILIKVFLNTGWLSWAFIDTPANPTTYPSLWCEQLCLYLFLPKPDFFTFHPCVLVLACLGSLFPYWVMEIDIKMLEHLKSLHNLIWRLRSEGNEAYQSYQALTAYLCVIVQSAFWLLTHPLPYKSPSAPTVQSCMVMRRQFNWTWYSRNIKYLTN